MSDKKKWQNIISVLRSGLTPLDKIEYFEVGREFEAREFERVLRNLSGSSTTKFICGAFGDGKSFLLNSIKNKAYSKNFVVSMIDISPNISLHNLDEIYISILRKLTCKNANSFAEIVNKWITKLNNAASKKFPDNISKQRQYVEDQIYSSLSQVRVHNPTFADIIKKFYEFSNSSKSDIAAYGLNWITGDSITSSAKKEFGLRGDINKSEALHYLQTLSIFFKAIGYSGFVILVDECEITMDSPVNYRKTAYNNIRMIYDATAANSFKSTLFVFAGIPTWFDSQNEGIKSNPALYGRVISRNRSKIVINLAKFNKNDAMKLIRKVSNAYEKAYNTTCVNKFSPYVSEMVEPFFKDGFMDNESLRGFITEYIDLLDEVRENPNKYKVRQDFLDLISGVDNNNDWF